MNAEFPKNMEEMRSHVLERFASLFHSQTRTRIFGSVISELVRNIHAEALAEREPDEIVTSFRRLDQTLQLLIEERKRQWQKNENDMLENMLEFDRISADLNQSLIERSLLERQSHVLESIILSHEKVAQWKEFVQEILRGFHEIFPFNIFFVAFEDEHGLSMLIYYLGDFQVETKSQARLRLAKELAARLGLPADVVMDIEEFTIDAQGFEAGSIDNIRIITVPVIDMGKADLSGILGVAYGAARALTIQEESVISSILAVMVMVVGSSKVLGRTLAELEYYSTHDPLTGLHNRRHFNEMLEYELGRSERHRHDFSMLVLDLDYFKDVNDTYGHPCGDGTLKLIAETMQASMRKGDLATRIGGDEFAVILTETGKRGAMAVAEKLRSQLREIVFRSPEGKPFHVTTSIGLATFPEDAQGVPDLMACADLSLYKAKKMGRDSVCIPGTEKDIRSERRNRDHAERLREALQEDRIVPFFQPIFDCRSGKVFAHETLARLVEPDGETVSAGMFIETIEKYGMGRELDRVIIRRALTLLKDAILNGCASRLFINLSAQEIQGRGILGYAENLCHELRIPPNAIVFEILERDAIGDMTNMRKFLTNLRDKGFAFALDDFGSGYNSFHYLRELRFDYVKIDGAFVRNILNSNIDHALVRNLSHLCRDIGIQTVAEFVESKAILDALRDMGIDYVQGFHLGMPFPRIEDCVIDTR